MYKLLILLIVLLAANLSIQAQDPRYQDTPYKILDGNTDIDKIAYKYNLTAAQLWYHPRNFNLFKGNIKDGDTVWMTSREFFPEFDVSHRMISGTSALGAFENISGEIYLRMLTFIPNLQIGPSLLVDVGKIESSKFAYEEKKNHFALGGLVMRYQGFEHGFVLNNLFGIHEFKQILNPQDVSSRQFVWRAELKAYLRTYEDKEYFYIEVYNNYPLSQPAVPRFNVQTLSQMSPKEYGFNIFYNLPEFSYSDVMFNIGSDIGYRYYDGNREQLSAGGHLQITYNKDKLFTFGYLHVADNMNGAIHYDQFKFSAHMILEPWFFGLDGEDEKRITGRGE